MVECLKWLLLGKLNIDIIEGAFRVMSRSIYYLINLISLILNSSG